MSSVKVDAYKGNNNMWQHLDTSEHILLQGQRNLDTTSIKTPCRILGKPAKTNNSERQAGKLQPERAVIKDAQEVDAGPAALSKHNPPQAPGPGGAEAREGKGCDKGLRKEGRVRQGGSWDLALWAPCCLCLHPIQLPLAAPTTVTMASRGWKGLGSQEPLGQGCCSQWILAAVWITP